MILNSYVWILANFGSTSAYQKIIHFDWLLIILRFLSRCEISKICSKSERVACLVNQTVVRLLEKGSIKLWYNNYHEKLWLSKKNYYWLISEKPVKTNRNNSKIAKNLKSQNSAIFDDFRWFLKIAQNFFENQKFSWIKIFREWNKNESFFEKFEKIRKWRQARNSRRS